MVKIKFLFWLLISVQVSGINAQPGNLSLDFGTSAGYITPGRIPFWLRSNQFGSVPQDKFSVSIISSLNKDYDRNNKGIFDWGGAIEGRLNLGESSNFYLIEGYGKFKISVFELKAGRSREVMGLCDTSLSSGSFSVSGNSLGIPKVQIAIPEYYSIPLFNKLFAFKGNFAHGWIGETLVEKLNDSITTLNTFLHQKSFYGRFGKPFWKWKLYGGFNHQSFWGDEDIYYGSHYTLSALQAYFYIITGKPYGTRNIPMSKIGNHLGSIDLGIEYNFRNIQIMIYRQNIYDIGALYYLANIRDGLNGLSLINIKATTKSVQWKKILFEFFYTKNQAGELWSPITPSGDENYYNNDQYLEGWSYKGAGIGNPFVSTQAYTVDGLPSHPRNFFINNRVILLHLGFQGSVENWDFTSRLSYSLNYGTYGTSSIGHSLGKIRFPPRYGIFKEARQFSAFLEGNKDLNESLKIGFITGLDLGKLYYNSWGIMFNLLKSFN